MAKITTLLLLNRSTVD